MTINDFLISGHALTDNCDQLLPERQLSMQTVVFILPTTEAEILGIILSLKDNKSTGFNNFSDELVKSISREIAHVIAHINVSFESGSFPEEQCNC